MGLLSYFQRRNGAAAGAAQTPPAGDDVAAARTRARRRLVGAAVLVAAGVIGFPLVFETQPRPIPVDIPIEIPRKDGAAALKMPPARPAAPREEIITESAADAGKPVAAPASAPAVAAAASAADVAKKPLAQPRPAAAAASSSADTARAQALLEGKEPARSPPPAAVVKPDESTAPGRYVVQVGAFADETAARETRSKVDKLGLKSYTQVVETSSGSRIRVRAGPFASRDEADKALAKARAAGLTTAVVLTL